ncbi:MAG TPA: hypothetical protein HA340_02920 [Candidatus Thalassarchaeaceae archaeon]|nr:MAG TPA: hypothetical protein D7H97_02870 [Candidatus Poseidoniales archaeon]HIH82878.1 hypothetical protein [Candidatus Thalassarchaeaceae archaeon]
MTDWGECLTGQQLEFDWAHEPPFVRHRSQGVVEQFFIWLGENGVARRSIPIPDRVGGGWILFIYQPVEKSLLEAWRPTIEEE